jgi:hypothetical protein
MNPLYIDIRSGHDALRRVSSGSVQQGLSVIRPRADRLARVTFVRPDGGKTLIR